MQDKKKVVYIHINTKRERENKTKENDGALVKYVYCK